MFQVSGQWRQGFAVAKNEPRELNCASQARNKNARLREKAEQPTEIKSIGPTWNCDLFSGQKSKRRPDAMDRRSDRSRPGEKTFAQKEAELFLWAASDRNDNVPGVATLDPGKQLPVFHHPAVDRRDVKVFIIKSETICPQPFPRFLCGSIVRQNPKRSCIFGKQAGGQALGVSQAGNATDFFAAENPPKQNHCAAVGNREVCVRNSKPIIPIASQSRKTGSGWCNQEAAVTGHFINRLIDVSVKKLDPEDLLIRHEANVRRANT